MIGKFSIRLLIMSLLFMPQGLLALVVSGEPTNLANHFEYIVDESKSLTLNDILSETYQQVFHLNKGSAVIFEAGTVVWLKLDLKFKEKQLGPHILSAIGNHYREIKFYRPDGEGGLWAYTTGNQYPGDQREETRAVFSFQLDPKTEGYVVYARVVSGVNMRLSKWMLMDEATFVYHSRIYKLFNFLSFGALMGIMLFSLGIGLTIKSRNYLFYSAYIFMGTLTIMNVDGTAFYWFWPNTPSFNIVSYSIFYLGLAFCRLLVIYGFLEISFLSPRMGAITRYWLIFLAIAFLAACAGVFEKMPSSLVAFVWLASLAFGTVLSVFAIFKKVPLSRALFFLLLLPLIGSLLQALESVGFAGGGALAMLVTKVTFVLHALLFSIVIALKIKHEERSAYIAQHDDLTGLESLSLTEQRFDKAVSMASRYQWDILVMFIDLDKFKPVNDTFGHEVGDHLLQAVSERITACTRKIDFVSRIGGDEFLVIQTEFKDTQSITGLGEKITAELAKPFDIDNHRVVIGASVGVARFPQDGQTLEELMGAADQAMYGVKRTGRNGVGVCEPTKS